MILVKTDWAHAEVEKLKNSEDTGDLAFAAEAALAALDRLLSFGHTKTSLAISRHIFDDLVNGRPLTPIEDIDSEWKLLMLDEDGFIRQGEIVRQAVRCETLFKLTSLDGTVTFNDINRVISIDVNTGAETMAPFVNKVINKLFPLELPYIPGEYSLVVMYETFSHTDKLSKGFDTARIIEYFDPITKEAVPVGVYYATNEKGHLYEISEEEFDARKNTYNLMWAVTEEEGQEL